MITIALIGVGGYGTQHVRGFSSLEQIGQVKVAAFADPSVQALEKAQSIFPRARSYTDYGNLLDQETVEAVVLATPIPLHEEMALKAIQRGIFILLEKPAVPLVSQWERLVRADIHGRIAVAFQRISSPGMQTVRKLIDGGLLGRVRSLSVSAVWPRATRYYERASWAGKLKWHSRPVLDGPMTNALSHFLNDIMFLASDPSGCPGIPEEICGEVYRARPIPSYDTACLRGRFPNGIHFFAGFSHASSEVGDFRLRVDGTKGSVWVEESGALRSENVAIPDFPVSDGRAEMRQAFVNFVAGRRPGPDVSLKDVEGYTLAANLMFQSSGGIHAIPPEFVRLSSDGKGGEFFEIRDIDHHLSRAAERLCSLSEVGVVWSRSGQPLKPRNFSEEKMLAALELDGLNGAGPVRNAVAAIGKSAPISL